MFVMDFYTRMLFQGRAFNVRAGTISVPLVGTVPITDTQSEMATSAVLGTTIIPVYQNISFNLAAGTLFETGGKSVGAVHSAGAAFVALPLKYGGSAATTTSAVAATAGTVTVTAEAVTTTRRHWAWAQPIAAGAWPTWYDWEPRVAPLLTGPSCYYVQVGGAGTGPSYFASYDFIELPSANV
jgi:hypothetical protein